VIFEVAAPEKVGKKITSALKRFISVFCKRKGADNSFLMVNLHTVSVFTFYLFWVKAPLSQHRPLQQNANTDIS
jgi:hypothetical protein